MKKYIILHVTLMLTLMIISGCKENSKGKSNSSDITVSESGSESKIESSADMTDKASETEVTTEFKENNFAVTSLADSTESSAVPPTSSETSTTEIANHSENEEPVITDHSESEKPIITDHPENEKPVITDSEIELPFIPLE